MFQYRHVIRMSETDCAGIIYFTTPLNIANHAFEDFLIKKGIPLALWIRQQDEAIPIVEVTGKFFKPLQIGDEVLVTLTMTELKDKAFTLLAKLECKGELVSEVKIVHVHMSKRKGKAISIPGEFQEIFHALAPASES